MNSVLPTNPTSVGAHLEQVARQHQVVTYGALVARFGLPTLDGAWAAHPLSQVFETLDQEDAIAGRPFRTSVVVSAAGSVPGNGYFEALARLKNIPDPGTSNGRQAVWIAELKAAHAYNWP